MSHKPSEVNYKSWSQGYMVWGKDPDGVDYEVSIVFYERPLMYPDVPPFWRVQETRTILILENRP